MSTDTNEVDEEMSRCASCGIAANDDIKLRKCTACHLVRYCGVQCQKDHWKEHKKECRKRAAELRRDELLFKQPESTHIGDCPICCIPLPLDTMKATMMPCCSKLICIGCDFAYQTRLMEDESLPHVCPFCRHPVPESQAEGERIHMKRVQANDPVALRQIGIQRDEEGDHEAAFAYLTKAAKLGDALAHYRLSGLYGSLEGVEGDLDEDYKKEVYHLEQAAIGGHLGARYELGFEEWDSDQFDRAIKHFIIGANLGHDESLKGVKEAYQDGLISKDDLGSALHAHKAAVDAMKSPQREAAEADVEYCEFRQKLRSGR